jgi:hypothetical protein
MAKQVKATTQPAAQSSAPPAAPKIAAPATLTGKPVTGAPQRLIPGEEEIRFRAYLKWEAAGRPVGDGQQFWLEAEREVRGNR